MAEGCTFRGLAKCPVKSQTYERSFFEGDAHRKRHGYVFRTCSMRADLSILNHSIVMHSGFCWKF